MPTMGSLGAGRRTIMGYLKKDELPSVVAIACRALARDKHLLAAHYVPARARSGGRPLEHGLKALVFRSFYGVMPVKAGIQYPPN
jgi:hypothetical protein